MERLRCPECQTEFSLDPASLQEPAICPGCAKPIRFARLAPEEKSGTPVPFSVPSFHPEPYRPDGGFSLLRLPILFGALALAAIAFGWLASFIGQWFYVVFIFPLVVASGVAMGGAWGAMLARMRNPLLGGLAGLLGGALAIVAMHYFKYQRHITQTAIATLELGSDGGKVKADPAQPKPTLAEVEDELRQQIGFGHFMNLRAEAGVRLGRKDDDKLGFIGSWVYWGVELAFVALLASYCGYSVARAPFCAECGSWKTDRTLGTLSETPEAIKALQTGDLTQVAESADRPSQGLLSISLAVCPICDTQASVVVKLERLVKDKENNVKKENVLELTYPGEALPSLEAVIQPSNRSEDGKVNCKREGGQS